MSAIQNAAGLFLQQPPPLPPTPQDARDAIETVTSQGANLGIWGPLGAVVLLIVGALLGLAFFGALFNTGVGAAKMGWRAGNTAEMAKAKNNISWGLAIMGVVALFAIVGGIVLAFMTYFGV